MSRAVSILKKKNKNIGAKEGNEATRKKTGLKGKKKLREEKERAKRQKKPSKKKGQKKKQSQKKK